MMKLLNNNTSSTRYTESVLIFKGSGKNKKKKCLLWGLNPRLRIDHGLNVTLHWDKDFVLLESILIGTVVLGGHTLRPLGQTDLYSNKYKR